MFLFEKSATHIETPLELHNFLRKVQLVQKTGKCCTFLEKNATRMKNYQQVARFFEKSETHIEIGWSCMFFKKSGTHIENMIELHVSQEKCNS